MRLLSSTLAFTLLALIGTPSLGLPAFDSFLSLVGVLQSNGTSGGGGGSNQTFSGPPGNLTEVNQTVPIAQGLQSNQSFSYLTKALQVTNATQLFNSTGGNFTVFAPVNSAFQQLPTSIQKLFERQSNRTNELIKALLLYHIVPSTVTPAQFQGSSTNSSSSNSTQSAAMPMHPLQQGGNQTSGGGEQGGTGGIELPSMLGNVSVVLNKDQQGTLMVNDARVLAVGNASNGVIYAIDKILTPLYLLNMSIYNLGGGGSSGGGGGGGNSTSSLTSVSSLFGLW
ncbi:hypothetical protein HDU97_004301 [Phlyctochytrium planicorne]|nr:hypothetical protein HDU97_004301 [Phlyctochytrium planicorne]